MTEPVIPCWLPNWENETEYPDPKETSKRQWVWEFLRRNLEYQQWWNEIIAPHFHSIRGGGKRLDQKAAMDALQKNSFPNLTGDVALTEEETCSAGSIFQIFTNKFGISYPLPPETTIVDDSFYPTYQSLSYNSWQSYHFETTGLPSRIETSIQSGQILIHFDLNWPVAPQIANAKIILGKEAKKFNLGKLVKQPRNRFKSFRKYLRILDGKLMKVDSKELALIIYPEKENNYPDYKASKKIDDDFNTAKRLRDIDYRYIAEPIRK